jgi:hypothetical protein
VLRDERVLFTGDLVENQLFRSSPTPTPTGDGGSRSSHSSNGSSPTSSTDRLTGRAASASGDGECPQHLEPLIRSAQVPAMFMDEHLSTWDVRC